MRRGSDTWFLLEIVHPCSPRTYLFFVAIPVLFLVVVVKVPKFENELDQFVDATFGHHFVNVLVVASIVPFDFVAE